MTQMSMSTAWLDAIHDAPVYHPTEEQFLDPLAFIASIQPEASRFGELHQAKFGQQFSTPQLMS